MAPNQQPSEQTPKPESILLVRPSALGDVCRTVPVLASLRAWAPGARIDWLVQQGFEDAVAHHPALTQVIRFPRRAVALGNFFKPKTAKEARKALFQLLHQLCAPKYDMVLDCQGLARSGLFAFLTGAKHRHADRDRGELSWLFANRRHRLPAASAGGPIHTVDRMLALTQAAGIPTSPDMRLYTSDADKHWASKHCASPRYTGDPHTAQKLVVLAPTTRWPGKAWPQDRFAALARNLLSQSRATHIAVVASAAEREHCRALLALAKDDPRIIDLTGKTTVGQLMATIERAALVVACDSAALHIAVGFDRPTVALFGPTREDLVGPYQRNQDVIRAVPMPTKNRHKDEDFGSNAMQAITLEQVEHAAIQRLAR